MQTPQQCLSGIIEETLTFWLERSIAGDVDALYHFGGALKALAAVDSSCGTGSAIDWLAQKTQSSLREAVPVAALNALLVMFEEAPDNAGFGAIAHQCMENRSEAIMARAVMLAILALQNGTNSSTLDWAVQESWKRLQSEKRVLLARELVSAPNHAGRLPHFLQNPREEYLPTLRAALLVIALGALPAARDRSEILLMLHQGLTHACWFIGQIAAEVLVGLGIAPAVEERQCAALTNGEFTVQAQAVAALGRLATAAHRESPALLQALNAPDVRLRAAAAEAIGQTLGACPLENPTAGLQALLSRDLLAAPLAAAALKRLHLVWAPNLSLIKTLWNALTPLSPAFRYEAARLNAPPKPIISSSIMPEMDVVLLLLEPEGGIEQTRREIENALRSAGGRTSTVYSYSAMPSGIVVLLRDTANGESSAVAVVEILEEIGTRCRSALGLTQVAVHYGKVSLKPREGFWDIGGNGWDTVRSVNALNEPNSIVVTQPVFARLSSGHPLRTMLHAQGNCKLADQSPLALSTYWNRNTGVGSPHPPRSLQSPMSLRRLSRPRLPKMRYVAVGLLALGGGTAYVLAPLSLQRLLQKTVQAGQELKRAFEPSPVPKITPGRVPDPARSEANAISPPPVETIPPEKPPSDTSQKATNQPSDVPDPNGIQVPSAPVYFSPEIRITCRAKSFTAIHGGAPVDLDDQGEAFTDPADAVVTIRIPARSAVPARIQIETRNCEFKDGDFDPDGFRLEERSLTRSLTIDHTYFSLTVTYFDKNDTEVLTKVFAAPKQVFRLP
jgi:hypothetical protein